MSDKILTNMSRLNDLYKAMETLRREGLSLNADLERQVSELEEKIIRKEILPVITQTIEPALKQVQRELVLVVDYHPGKPISVSLSRKKNISKVIDAKILVEEKPTPISQGSMIRQTPSSSQGVTTKTPYVRSYANADRIIKQFASYMRRIKHAESTVNGYIHALDKYVTPYVIKLYDRNAESIFSFTDPKDVRSILNVLLQSNEFYNQNEDMHHEMSCAIKKYIYFLNSIK